jgi:Exonuclease III
VRIATWNVNSIKQRLDAAVTWLAERQPTSCVSRRRNASMTPFRASHSSRSATISQSTDKRLSNGVALLSKFPLDEVSIGLPGDHSDDHARFIEGVVSTAKGALRVASIYLPNGNPPETDKYAYKIGWMKRLLAYADDVFRSASRSSSPATTTSSRRRPTSAIRKTGGVTRCSCRAPARPSNRS